ncbi:dephospho-CoA kinase [Tamlana sp. 2_MG-2023]|uniref:dephospho-CoA kinase n=1 Tax=unclassified Tamlana TaxID=2614803 RepID=UPI0026E38699|nr:MULTISPECIES: dephospho-CoA kinase [unclassified Tamlana]MDO6759110.1 dephospho-CoA kinase [Tamlana sp. 2_MG-2023]MDO6789809.1 dephospho-CoA kinase [Tamlana sp. 1_MG-2023]
MTIVGLTGGIGSGKTTVAKMFNEVGIPVYIADVEAKKLMNASSVVKQELIELFGENAYLKEGLNKPFIANIIFNDKSYLQKMNAIVHPRVAEHFEAWVLEQRSAYVIKEVAILFENGGDKACDYVISVTAPKSIRMERVLKRDGTTKEKIEAIMNNQWTDAKKVTLSDFVVFNTVLEETKRQVLNIHEEILRNLKF